MKRRLRRRALPKAPIPSHRALEYVLTEFADRREAAWRAGLRHALAEYRTLVSAVRQDDVETPLQALQRHVDALTKRTMRDVRKALLAPIERPDMSAAARRITRASVAAANYQLRDLGVGSPFTETPGQRRVAEAGAQRMLAELDAVEAKLAATLESEIADSLAVASRVDVLERRIDRRFAVGRSETATVADTGTARLNSELVQERNQALGIERYMWVSSRDERVRRRHIELDKTIQQWDSPPEAESNGARYNPGSRHRCRCTASALVDDVLDALNA